jgi:hypothetical protein
LITIFAYYLQALKINNMKNITKLKAWPALEKLGFVPIRFISHGKVQAIGASNNKITIEPHNYKEKPYHISGHSNKPITRTLYRYEYGRKVEIFETDTFYNKHHKARDIVKVINELNN